MLALTIAGSDPSGGAGIQADLKTFHRFGVYGAAVVSLITVQNTRGVLRSDPLSAELVAAQLDAVLADLPVRAVKTGALGSAEIIESIAARALPQLVVDPVMLSSGGVPLLDPDARRTLRDVLFRHAALAMPNLPEAAALTGCEVRTPDQMREAARRVADFGPRAVLIKGGHLESGDALDILYRNGAFAEFRAPRLATRHTHGTGCTYSAAIAALLARGLELEAAVGRAKAFVTEAIRTAPGLGAGNGPLNHFANLPDSL